MDRSTSDGTRDVRRRYQRIASFYDLLDLPFEYGRYRWFRPLLFEGLSGRILDVGIGTGRNLPFYPASTEVVGVDLSPAMLQRAERRRALSAASVELAVMDVTCLAFPEASFDAAVASFLFCTLPDVLQVPALWELGRVVKPGGCIRLLDYTLPGGAVRRFSTRLWAPWVHWAYGARFDRHPERHFAKVGLIQIASRFVVDDLVRLIDATPQARSNEKSPP